MKAKTKPKVNLVPKVSTAVQLRNAMNGLKAEVELGGMSDKSCVYVNIEKGGYELCISFDPTGEKVTDIMMSKQITQVVDLASIWKC